MRYILLVIALSFIFTEKSFSQTKAAAAATAAPASAGNSQTGYVYRLKYRFHIRYGITKKGKELKPLPAANALLPVSYTVHMRKDTVQRLPRDTVITELVSTAGPIPQKEMSCQDCPPVKYNHKDWDSTFSTCIAPGCVTTPSTYADTIYIDSVSRYWNAAYWTSSSPNENVGRYRLRVSITQADSGKLVVGIFDNSYLSEKRIPEAKDIDARIFSFGLKQDTDYAFPITANDSADAFYLQINNKVTVGSPMAYISLPYSLTQFGAFTVPFKYRWAPKNTNIRGKPVTGSADTVLSAPSESSASLNLAAYVCRKWGRTRFYFDPSKTHNTTSFMLGAFLGPTLVPLSSTNLIAADSNKVNSPTNILALSMGGAAVFEWRFVDIGLFGGWDVPLVGNSGWIYRDKFWIGFGIGVNLGMFSTGTSQAQL